MELSRLIFPWLMDLGSCDFQRILQFAKAQFSQASVFRNVLKKILCSQIHFMNEKAVHFKLKNTSIPPYLPRKARLTLALCYAFHYKPTVATKFLRV